MAVRTLSLPLAAIGPAATGHAFVVDDAPGTDASARSSNEELAMRQTVRTTAGKMLRSDDLVDGEKDAAAAILVANPALGNPHVVRCPWCHETRTLFRDESEEPFKLTSHGWTCEACSVGAASQEVRF